MQERKSSLNTDNLQAVLDANGAQKGQQQYWTPPEIASALCSAFGRTRYAIADLQCGNGALLNAASNATTKSRLGVDIDPRSRSKERITIIGDCVEIHSLLREADVKFPLVLANPPFGVRWPVAKLPVGARYFADGRELVDSTVGAWVMANESLAKGGEGYMICNAATRERLLVPGAPFMRRVWLVLEMPNFFPGVSDKLRMEVVFFAECHYSELEQRVVRLAEPSPQLIHETVRREMRGGYAFYKSQSWKNYSSTDEANADETIRRFFAVREEWLRREAEREGARPKWNIWLERGKIKTYLTPFQEVSATVPRHLAEELHRLNGKSPVELAVLRETRDALTRAVSCEWWRVHPNVKAAVEGGLRDYHALRAPFNKPSNAQAIAWLDEEDRITANRNVANAGVTWFSAGKSYKIESRTFEGRKIELRPRVGDSTTEEVLVTGQELMLIVTSDTGQRVAFTQHALDLENRAETEGLQDIDASQTLFDLMEWFVIPDVKDLAELNAKRFAENLSALADIEQSARPAIPVPATPGMARANFKKEPLTTTNQQPTKGEIIKLMKTKKNTGIDRFPTGHNRTGAVKRECRNEPTPTAPAETVAPKSEMEKKIAEETAKILVRVTPLYKCGNLIHVEKRGDSWGYVDRNNFWYDTGDAFALKEILSKENRQTVARAECEATLELDETEATGEPEPESDSKENALPEDTQITAEEPAPEQENPATPPPESPNEKPEAPVAENPAQITTPNGGTHDVSPLSDSINEWHRSAADEKARKAKLPPGMKTLPLINLRLKGRCDAGLVLLEDAKSNFRPPKEILKAMAPAICKDKNRFVLTKVFDDKERGAWVATTGRVLYSAPAPEGGRTEENDIWFLKEEEGKFPAYEGVIPKNDVKVKVSLGFADAESLTRSCAAAIKANVAFGEKSPTKPAVSVGLEFLGKGEKKPLTTLFPPVAIRDALAFMFQGWSGVSDTRRVVIEYRGFSPEPLTFRDEANPIRFAIVMPLHGDMDGALYCLAGTFGTDRFSTYLGAAAVTNRNEVPTPKPTEPVSETPATALPDEPQASHNVVHFVPELQNQVRTAQENQSSNQTSQPSTERKSYRELLSQLVRAGRIANA